ncbi:hypothetical protein F2Q68_00016360 [Brassica cretica]|uniref:Uncharacterized protein n=1 Tax=Brassica cretica TaxID=69181 RepID=A0A8S9HC48_BRACR|nr:hypothetical protein F2Q68_00016360 [Brassica cretica]
MGLGGGNLQGSLHKEFFDIGQTEVNRAWWQPPLSLDSWKPRALLVWELGERWKKEASIYSANPPAHPHRLTTQDPLMEEPRKHMIEAKEPSGRNQILHRLRPVRSGNRRFHPPLQPSPIGRRGNRRRGSLRHDANGSYSTGQDDEKDKI